MRPAQIVIGIVVALTLAGGGFAAGLTVGRERAAATATADASPASASATRRAAGSGGPQVLGGGGGISALGGQPISGRVISVNDGSITIETRQGGGQGASPAAGSQIVLVGSSTRVVRTVEQDIKLADIKPNDQVVIVGSADASGTLSANAILVGANAFQQLLGGARPSASPRP